MQSALPLLMKTSASEAVSQTRVAQFIAVCRRSQSGYMGTRRHPRGSPLYTRWTLKWRGDDQSLSQFLRATNYDKLSECLNLQERIDGQVVYPSTGFATAILSSFTEEMISEPVINGKRWLPIRGCFAYRTFDQVRHSSFCYVYKGGITQPNQVDICKDGNYAD